MGAYIITVDLISEMHSTYSINKVRRILKKKVTENIAGKPS